MDQGDDAFRHDEHTFERSEAAGAVVLSNAEVDYGELFTEVIWDGLITPDKRAHLDRAAQVFGLGRDRVRRIEQALQAAYEARHRVRVREERAPATPAAEAGPPGGNTLPAPAPGHWAAQPEAPPGGSTDQAQWAAAQEQQWAHSAGAAPDAYAQQGYAPPGWAPAEEPGRLPAPPPTPAGGFAPPAAAPQYGWDEDTDADRAVPSYLRDENAAPTPVAGVRAASPVPAWPASPPPSISWPPAAEQAPDTTAQPRLALRASEPPGASGGFLAPTSVAPLGAEVRAGFEESRPSFSPFMPAPQEEEPYLYALQRRIAYLESQNHELVARNTDLESRLLDLEQELDLARRGSIDVEISMSDGSALADLVAARSSSRGDPGALHRGIVEAPREIDRVRALFRSLRRASDADRRWSTAQVLTALDPDGDAEAREAFDAHRPEGLIRPSRSLGEELWRSLLLHPDEDPLPGDIFSVVVPAVLLARASTQRRERNAPRLDPTRRVNPAGSTIQAVRCLGWAAAILGMEPPPLYAEPEWNGLLEAVVAVPLSTRLGRAALSGRSAPELAFLAGRHLSWFRRAHVIVKLCGSTRELEDVFLAALTIGNPGLPMRPEVRTRVQPVARAIEPLLDSAAIAALRGHVLVFIEQGGRTHLRRWAMAADRTAARAGLLLSNDLGAARAMLELEDPRRAPDLLDDLVGFATSERYAELRAALGVSVVP